MNWQPFDYTTFNNMKISAEAEMDEMEGAAEAFLKVYKNPIALILDRGDMEDMAYKFAGCLTGVLKAHRQLLKVVEFMIEKRENDESSCARN